MSKEIYEGGLNKFLLYPLSFYKFKFTTYLAHSFFYFVQLILIIAIYQTLFYDPSVFVLSLSKVLMFTIAVITCSSCYFLMISIIELISFWADNIWSLNVIVRFAVAFFGGVLIPLSFFPKDLINILNLTPFPYLVNFPMQILTKGIGTQEFVVSILILLSWSTVFALASFLTWSKGKYKYTGVGI